MSGDYIPLSYRADPEGEAVALVPSAIHRREAWAAVLGAFAAETAELERELHALLVDGLLSTASGDRLRRYGALVGEIGAGMTEAEFRRIIAGRIAASRSDGSRQAVAETWRALTSTDSHVIDVYPAGVFAWATVAEFPSSAFASRAGRVFRDSLHAAISADLVLALEGTIILVPDDGTAPAFDGPVFALDL